MTDRYAVIGISLSHTRSPLIHTAFARERQGMQDTAAPLDGFGAAGIHHFHENLRGKP